MKEIKKAVFYLLDPEQIETRSEKYLDAFILTLISLNTLAVLIEPSVSHLGFKTFLTVFETFSVVFFSIEYILRFWVSDLYRPYMNPNAARFRYMIEAMAIIDLLAILPFYLTAVIAIDLRVLHSLRLFRLFRLFKANRYVKSLHRVLHVLKIKSSELLSSILVILVLMIASASVMYNFEHNAQPDSFTTVFDALWWAIGTLTLTGRADIFPVTVIGKILAGVIALLGIGMVAIPTGIIASGFSEMKDKKHEEKISCPHCGAVFHHTTPFHEETDHQPDPPGSAL